MEALSCGLCGSQAGLGEQCLQRASLYRFDCPPLGREGHENRKCSSFFSLIWTLWSGQRGETFFGHRDTWLLEKPTCHPFSLHCCNKSGAGPRPFGWENAGSQLAGCVLWRCSCTSACEAPLPDLGMGAGRVASLLPGLGKHQDLRTEGEKSCI